VSEPHDRAPGLGLAALQRWFLEAVVGPHRSAPAGVIGAAPVAVPDVPVEAVIRPSRTLDPAARVAIYSRMYFWRLHNVLARTYATVRRLMGDDGFQDLVRDYLTRFPPRSFAINDVDLALPHHLAAYGRDLPQAALLLDVARVEQAMSESFDVFAAGTATAADLARIPPEDWGEVRFRLDPSMRLLALDHDALAFVHAVKNDKPLPEPAPRRTFAAVWRQNYVVWRKPLGELAHTILVQLGRGVTLGEAMETAAARWAGAEAELERDIFQWFSAWLEDGFFCAVIPPRD
jgi:hypothetical protein